MKRSKSTDPPTNREMINKIDNDITLLRGEVMRLTELVKILTDFKKKERDGFFLTHSIKDAEQEPNNSKSV